MLRLSIKMSYTLINCSTEVCYITHILFVPLFVKLTIVYNFDRGANASAWRNKQPRKPTMSMACRLCCILVSTHLRTGLRL